jgi:hypothetical protein
MGKGVGTIRNPQDCYDKPLPHAHGSSRCACLKLLWERHSDATSANQPGAKSTT